MVVWTIHVDMSFEIWTVIGDNVLKVGADGVGSKIVGDVANFELIMNKFVGVNWRMVGGERIGDTHKRLAVIDGGLEVLMRVFDAKEVDKGRFGKAFSR